MDAQHLWGHSGYAIRRNLQRRVNLVDPFCAARSGPATAGNGMRRSEPDHGTQLSSPFGSQLVVSPREFVQQDC